MVERFKSKASHKIVGVGGLDALAVSVGSVHLAEERASEIDCDALAATQAVTRVPLVLHGRSGIPIAMRERLVQRATIASASSTLAPNCA